MKLIENNKFRMAQVLLNFLNSASPAVLLLLPLLSSLTASLELIVNAIIAAELTRSTAVAGKVGNKKAKRTALVNITRSVGKAISAFAANSGNVELKGKMKELLANLKRQTEASLLTRCNAIFEIAVSNDSQLAPVGITDSVRDILAASIADFQNQTPVIRSSITTRKGAGKEITLQLKAALTLMIEQIDPLVHSLRGQDAFVRDYDSNRMVIDIGHRHTQFKGQLMAKDTKTPLTGVQLEFKNSGGSVLVKANKTYKELVNPDIYDIIATHPDYEPFVMEGVQIRAGEIKVENFQLTPKAV